MRDAKLVLTGLLLVLGACKAGTGPDVAASGGSGQALRAGGAADPRPAPGAADLPPGKYFLHADTTLRLTPSPAERVPDPHREGETSNNWVGDVYRGNLFQLELCASGYCRVKHGRNGAEGWVPAASLVAEAGVYLATVVEDTAVVDPQTGTALDKEVEAGNLMVAVESRGEITRVGVGDGSFAWVKSSALTDDDKEVRVAYMIAVTRHHLEQGIPGDLKETYDLARVKMKDAKLLPVLERNMPVNEINRGAPVFTLSLEDVRP